MSYAPQDDFELLSVKCIAGCEFNSNIQISHPVSNQISSSSEHTHNLQGSLHETASSSSFEAHTRSIVSNTTIFTNIESLPTSQVTSVDVQPLSQLTNYFSLPQSLIARLISGDVTEVRVLRFPTIPRPTRSVDPNIPPTRFVRRGTRR